MTQFADVEVRTIPGLWRWYDSTSRQLSFHAQSKAETLAWQATLKNILTELLGNFPMARAPLSPVVVETTQENDVRRELVLYQSDFGEFVPCYVLTPTQVRLPLRPVIALHGHGSGGARHILGMASNNAEAEHIRVHNYDYARQLAVRGFMVFAPVQRGFAERMDEGELSDIHNSLYQDSCRAASLNALLCGKTLIGLRVWDIMRLVDYIKSRPEPLNSSIGCVGLSGGGTVTLYATALEPRISIAVVSGAFNPFRDSIMPIKHCLCNYIPRILQYAEISDIAGLIAPRPLLIENGSHDPDFPIAGTRRALEEVRRVYAQFDAQDQLAEDLFDGGHRWNGAHAYDWLDRHLRVSQDT